MVLLEYLPHGEHLGLHLVVARRSKAALALFEPVPFSLCEFRAGRALLDERTSDAHCAWVEPPDAAATGLHPGHRCR